MLGRASCFWTLGVALALGLAGAMADMTELTAQEPVDQNPPQIIERVLAKINGEILTQGDLENRQVNELQRRGYQPTNDADLMRILNEVTPEIIASLVDELLLVQRGRGLGFGFTDELFDDFLTDARSGFRVPGQEQPFETNEEMLQAFEEAEGITKLELRRTIERQMLSQQTMQVEILNKVNITDTEARAYYEEHLSDYTTPPTAALREILIAVPDGASRSAEEAAKTTAKTTVTRLRQGADFAVLAAEVSDSPSKENGGKVGPLLVSEYSNPIQGIINDLENGEIAEPIRTAQGFQIVMLELRADPSVRPFDEVRDDISSGVFGDRRNEAYNQFIERLRDQAVIQWHSDEIKEMYETYRAASQDGSAGPLF